jgi:hypothetical protein
MSRCLTAGKEEKDKKKEEDRTGIQSKEGR